MNKLFASIRFLFRERLNISSNLIHTRIINFEFKLTQKDVSNYNEAIENSKGSIFKTSIHPLFYTKVSWQIIENLNDYIETRIDEKVLKTIVHLSEYFYYYKKIKTPADLTVKSKIWSIAPHKKGAKMIIKFEYYCNNELIAVEFSGGLLFGVKCIDKEQSLGEIPKTKRIENLPIWTKTIEIVKDLPFTYANKAEIDAPIHTNPKFAKSIGLPNIILQGTCTFAKSLELILCEELNDTDQIKSVSAMFTGMVVPPNQIIVRLLKKEKKSLYFDVLNNKNEFVIKGGQILLKQN